MATGGLLGKFLFTGVEAGSIQEICIVPITVDYASLNILVSNWVKRKRLWSTSAATPRRLASIPWSRATRSSPKAPVSGTAVWSQPVNGSSCAHPRTSSSVSNTRLKSCRSNPCRVSYWMAALLSAPSQKSSPLNRVAPMPRHRKKQSRDNNGIC